MRVHETVPAVSDVLDGARGVFAGCEYGDRVTWCKKHLDETNYDKCDQSKSEIPSYCCDTCAKAGHPMPGEHC